MYLINEFIQDKVKWKLKGGIKSCSYLMFQISQKVVLVFYFSNISKLQNCCLKVLLEKMASSCNKWGVWTMDKISYLKRDNKYGIYFCFLIIITEGLNLCWTLLNLLVLIELIISVIKTDQNHILIRLNMTDFAGPSFTLNT